MGIDGRIANQARFIVDAAGRLIGYRNNTNDQDEVFLTPQQMSVSAFNASPLGHLYGAGNANGLAAPTRTVPFIGTSQVYINIGAAGTNAGTFANPINTSADAITAIATNAVAGQEFLFPAGTTQVFGAVCTPKVVGTESAPVVLGVYDPATGTRIHGLGLAALTFTGQTIGLNIAANSWLCIDSLDISGTTTIGALRIHGVNSNIQVLNCILHDNATSGIRFTNPGGGASNTNIVIEGNRIHNNTQEGIYLNLFADDSTTAIKYNHLYSNGGQGGLYVVDSTNTYTFSGTVACNTSELHASGVGVFLSCGGGGADIYRNLCRKNKIGIFAQTTAAASKSFAGLVIENNECNDNGNFGIELVGAFGDIRVRWNDCCRNGSTNGGVTAGASNFGRGIELYGADAARGCRNVLIEGNYCAGNYNFISNVSEGCGIGLDNNSRYCRVVGNYCENNEGNSIQVNQASYNEIAGNICVNGNANWRAGTGTTNCESEIFISGSKRVIVENNTLVSRKSRRQKFGISEYLGADNTGCVYRNNLVIGTTVAGIERNTGATGASETYTVAEDCPVVAVDSALAPTAAGTGSQLVAAGATGTLLSPMYKPRLGAACDNGLPGNAWVRSFDGEVFGSRVPIGAMLPA